MVARQLKESRTTARVYEPNTKEKYGSSAPRTYHRATNDHYCKLETDAVCEIRHNCETQAIVLLQCNNKFTQWDRNTYRGTGALSPRGNGYHHFERRESCQTVPTGSPPGVSLDFTLCDPGEGRGSGADRKTGDDQTVKMTTSF